jgi:polar amino acid transport system substrate-binding protein
MDKRIAVYPRKRRGRQDIHRRTGRSVLALSLTAAALMGMTACGTAAGAGGDQSSGNGASGSGMDLLTKVQKTHVLSVALASFPPLEYQDPKTQQWTGVDIDLLNKFASSLGAKLAIHSMAFPASIQSVASKRDDITANIFKTPDRQRVLSFSDPVIKYVDGVIVNSQNPQVKAATVNDLQGKSIATCNGCAEQPYVAKVPGATNKGYDSVNETFLALSAGRVDADFQPVMFAQWAVHENPSLHIKVLGAIPVAVTGKGNQAPAGYYGVAQGPYSKRFLDKLNAFLSKERSDGDLTHILKKYGLNSQSYLRGIDTMVKDKNTTG